MPIENVMPFPGTEPPEQEIEVEVGEEPAVEEVQEEDVEISHFDNLADLLDKTELTAIATDLLSVYEEDVNSRSEWLDQYTSGLDYLGFKQEDRSQPFKGASGVFHPVMTEAVVRFQSNAIMEIFPASGPVLTKILGNESPDKIRQALRIKEELNYQLTENMPEFRPEMEQLLFRLPLAGSVFKKTYYDSLFKRPSSCMVIAEDLVVNYHTTNIECAERIAHVNKWSANKLKKMMRAGLYRTVTLSDPVIAMNDEGRQKEDELSGVEPTYTAKNSPHTVIEFHVSYNLPGIFADKDGIADPYIITIEKGSQEVLGIRRNWAEEDNEDRKPLSYFTHYQYMPGFGFYGIGLIHLMGAIAKASTSILRQLIDAGTLANLPGGLKTRGLRTKGGEDPISPGEWRDVDVPAGKLQENIMPLPYKEPSGVLAALMQNLIEEGRRIGSIADVDIGSGGENTPVGTTLAVMERSLKVMSAVHARLHAALKKELKLIAKVIADYMPPQYDWDEDGKFNRQEDFDSRVDIIPVSDPNAATQAQRIVQMQAVMQLASQAPELYNMKELHRAALQAINIKNDESILPMDEDPPRLDPVQENMRVLTQQPIKVFPDQDHDAHIKSHFSAMTDPSIMEMVGQSPNAIKLQGQMEAHMAEHLAHKYRQEIQKTMGVELPPIGEELPPEIENRLSRMVAEAAQRLKDQHIAEAKQKEAEQIASDPVFQLREREVALKEAEFEHQKRKDAAADIIKVGQTASKEALDLRRIESEEARASMNIGANLVTFGAELEAEERRQGIELGESIQQNLQADFKDFHRDFEKNRLERDRLNHEAVQNERDRQHDLEVAAKQRQSREPSS
jgi:hypothetical protein